MRALNECLRAAAALEGWAVIDTERAGQELWLRRKSNATYYPRSAARLQMQAMAADFARRFGAPLAEASKPAWELARRTAPEVQLNMSAARHV